MGKQDEGKLADNARALELMSSFRARLYVDAMELCHDPIMAESLVLHAIDSALRNYSAEEVGGYNLLKTILKNIWLNENRRLVNQATTPVDMDEMEDALVSNATEDEILRNSDSEAVREAIGLLAPEYKRTVVMHYMMDMPLKEIAKVLRRPIGTVKWRLNVAKGVLAGMLKRSLGRPGTWVALAIGLLVGCTTALIVMRLPPRKPTDPVGGIAYNTPKVHEIAVRRAPKDVKIDGSLFEWTSPVFEAACDEPYDLDYRASIRMMWDEKSLYIGGDIRTPDPMRNMSAASGTHPFAGGSVICRLAADCSAGWPLPEKMVYNSKTYPAVPPPDEGLVSLILYYDADFGSARISVHRGMRRQTYLDVPRDAWSGAYRRHGDGAGYSFEYSIAWTAAGIAPPECGETRANTWNIHFGDSEGLSCSGQISENVVPDVPRKCRRFPFGSFCYLPPLWGKAVFE